MTKFYSERKRGWLSAVLVFILSLFVASLIIWKIEDAKLQKKQAIVTGVTHKHSDLLEKNIAQKLALTYTIAAILEHEGGVFYDFDSIAEKLISFHPSLSEIALAPQGIISQVVPLNKNKKALGHNLFTDPHQHREALLARDTGKLTLAGPLELVQGGKGVVGRLPVFIGEDKKFWGFVLIVIRMDTLLNTAMLSNLKEEGFHYSLTRLHPNTRHIQIIASSTPTPLDHPIKQIITLPNAQWILSIAPIDGWRDQTVLWVELLLGLIISLLLGFIAKQFFELQLHRTYLENLIHQRTYEILKTKNQLRTLLNTIPDLIWLKNRDGVYLQCNPMFERFFGAKEEEIIGKTDYDFVENGLADFFRENDRLAMYADQPTINEEWVTFAQDGHRALLETIKIPMYDDHQTLMGVLGIARDITQRHNDELRIKRLSQFYAARSQGNYAIVHSTTDTELFAEVCKSIVSVGGIEMAWIGRVDPKAGLITPVASYGEGVEYLEGIHISTDPNEPSGRGPTAISIRENRPYWCQDFMNDPITAPWHERGEKMGWKASASLPIHRYGEAIGTFTIYSKTLNAFDSSIQELLLQMIMDMSYGIENYDRESKRKSAEEKAHWLTHFDILTGLPNRTLLNDRVQNAISIAYRAHVPLALLFLDLDHFKNINDSLGHEIGDALLIEVASRMRSVMREGDTLSRQGGDEFIVLLPGTDAEGAAHVAEKILSTISNTCQIDQHELVITPSIGIALYPIDGKDFQTLFQSADAAMYRAKHDGRNCYRFFTPEIQTRHARNFEIENGLRHALERHELELHYQPQIAVDSGKIVGSEALLRWNHPILGSVSPAEFIPIAEFSGQIIVIGEWVMRRALQQLKEWIEGGMEPFIMAVNLSALQFRHPAFVSMVLSILEEVQINAEYLELELTEGIAMENPLEAIDIMNRLHDHGIRMSIDDFGTGYSSLNYLKKFNVYKLKIDQSFVRDIAENSEDKTIVNTIINMAHNLNMQTIAEGVETLEQLEFLRENGCDEIQGYYYSKPLPAKEFEAFVASRPL